MQKTRKTLGFVYLITSNTDSDERLYKIGVTTGKLDKRVKQLQTGNAEELFVLKYHETPHPFKIEKLLHNKFTQYRKLNEWFRMSDDDVIHFQDRCNDCENVVKALEDNPFF